MKTSELIGAQLDWAVAVIEKQQTDILLVENKLPVIERTVLGHTDIFRCEFSTNWAQGGPIVEREKIDITTTIQDPAGAWRAAVDARGYVGDTPLIAAMRCLVASKLGDEVEVPEELA